MSEQTLFRLRVRYLKRGRLRYLGHLEVAHTIERVVRRAGLPYAVTQGFSPHMRVAFSSALPVGTGSTCEWFDLVLTAYVPVAEALPRLIAATPADLAPQEAVYVDMRAPALTAWLTRATYRVDLWLSADAPDELETYRRALDAIRAEEGIDYQRGSKRRRLDLRKTLAGYELAWGADSAHAPDDEDDAIDPGATPASRHLVLTLETRMDNEGAMRPEILLAALDRRIAPAQERDAALISTGMARYQSFTRVETTRVAQSGDPDA